MVTWKWRFVSEGNSRVTYGATYSEAFSYNMVFFENSVLNFKVKKKKKSKLTE